MKNNFVFIIFLFMLGFLSFCSTKYYFKSRELEFWKTYSKRLHIEIDKMSEEIQIYKLEKLANQEDVKDKIIIEFVKHIRELKTQIQIRDDQILGLEAEIQYYKNLTENETK